MSSFFCAKRSRVKAPVGEVEIFDIKNHFAVGPVVRTVTVLKLSTTSHGVGGRGVGACEIGSLPWKAVSLSLP